MGPWTLCEGPEDLCELLPCNRTLHNGKVCEQPLGLQRKVGGSRANY